MFVNKSYPLFEELKSTIFKTIGVRGTLESVLRKQRGIEHAFVYGSFAKNAEHAYSDIDLCLVVKKNEFKEETFLKEIHTVEKQLGREISYVFFTREEWEEKKAAQDSFILGVLKNKRIELI